MSETSTRSASAWSRYIGLDERANRPQVAEQADRELTIWRQSKTHSWACNTMVLRTISNRLRQPETLR